jgi:broad specificity phosphatase PhoE/8-oxo-dGTP pyrophosphatase MutT (NUDIX family)
MDKPIEASGGLVVLPASDGIKVLVAHRPRYDDWTFPKGKNEAGENPFEAAVREVAEETGQNPRLVSSLGQTEFDTGNGVKRVRWFGMRLSRPDPFVPNAEVDEIRWLDPDEARSLLTYEGDGAMLDQVDLDALAATGTLFLVRHGAAGDRNAWEGDDHLRPLSSKGERQATGLVKTLANREIEAIHTSTYLRCIQTVSPLAEATGLEIIEQPELTEGEGGKATRDLLRELAGTNAVLCSHGDVIPEVMEWMVGKGMTLKSQFDCKKGSVWEVEVRGGEFRKARYLPPTEA